jgi:CubicO group peptidase (beta-lactamase class C family)
VSRARLLARLLVIPLLWACGDAPTGPSTDLPAQIVDLSLGWSTAEATRVGFDGRRLGDALEHARDLDFLRGLVIARNGYLVHEEYYGGHTRDSLADVRSVTKAVISTLVGIAIRDGLFSGVEQSLGELLPASAATLEPEKRAVSLLHLLTMTSGFDWHESGPVGYSDWYFAADHIRYLTDRPLSDAPGTRFNYNSAAAHLLSVVLTEQSGTATAEFARIHLLEPIGIDSTRWERLSGGYANGGSGFAVRPRDLARLGQLFLQHGASGIRQVVPTAWTLEATTPRFDAFAADDPLRSLNYGYLWWIEPVAPHPAFFAWGYGGQFLYIVPSLNLVIVTTSEWRVAGTAGTDQAARALSLIIDHIIPAAIALD